MLMRALVLFGFVTALGACSTGQLSKHQLRECCMAGAFERCGNGCIRPADAELGACREYQTCRAQCAGRNEYRGQPLDGHPSTCAKLCARRAVELRPSIPPRCPANQVEGDLPEAADSLDIGEMPNDRAGDTDLPNNANEPDLPENKESAMDLPGETKPDLPPDPDK